MDKPSQNETEQQINKEYHQFIVERNHPCIMANTVFSMGDYNLKIYDNFGSAATAIELVKALNQYLESYNFDDHHFKTFIAVFPDSKPTTEKEFENLLWNQLQNIHEKDSKAWDPKVSKNPHDDHFSFSIGGHAFYIVGMHPKSSRIARQSPYPTLVFNLHLQFEKLREMGVYRKIRDKIRERDLALQGSINPVLEDFGKNSEARQYSGRNIEKNWKCPFQP